MSAEDDPQTDQEPRLWRVFNLVYLLFYFTGWLWRAPQAIDLIAAAAAIAIFLPVYFRAYECSDRGALPYIAIMEGLAWATAGFAGIHGVFHTYACVQAAFQRPRRRGMLIIGLLSVAYGAFAIATRQPYLSVFFNLGFGIIIGIACTATAESIERERKLKRTQVLERQQATLAERERIAHELHDLLGHTLTMVALKAEVAAKLLQRDPERAGDEMREVATAARSALSEIRAAVYDMTATSVESEIDRARLALDAAGVDLEIRGDVPRTLGPTLGKTLGLSIREATTNIVRHSQASAARIELDHAEDRVELVVADNGVGTASAREGAGLSGLRNRVEALGGDAKIDREGGMQIRIRLPLSPLGESGGVA
ncbi:MAG: sensor histidine kinase [Pseudomonadota bacterium]